MLVKKNRLNKKRDFDNIFKNGKSTKGLFLVLRFIKNKLEFNRYAFIVSKKVSQKAVIRNKVRRRLLESVKKNEEKLKKGLDIIFIALPTVKDKNFLQIKEEVDSLLSKIILKDKI